ncbi:MAG: hypothetical protein IIZ75_03580 [Lachnospiraceae bacterium]|nr:hypothetical protein [Lachnospiraceae bacterium]
MDENARMEEGLYTQELVPLFRDAEADGLLGIRGYFNLFQDMACAHMHELGIGNDKLVERTGCAWLFTKYKLCAYGRSDFDTKLKLETWIEPVRSPLLVNRGLWVSANGRLLAAGRVESCPFNLKDQKLVRLSDLDFQKEVSCDREDGLGRFTRVGISMEGAEYRFTHTVRYADLDKSQHMNNIKYIDMFLNVFSREFYMTHFVTGMEIQFRNQCFEGDEILVYTVKEKRVWEAQEEDERIRLIAVKQDKTIAATGMITIKDIS